MVWLLSGFAYRVFLGYVFWHNINLDLDLAIHFDFAAILWIFVFKRQPKLIGVALVEIQVNLERLKDSLMELLVENHMLLDVAAVLDQLPQIKRSLPNQVVLLEQISV